MKYIGSLIINLIIIFLVYFLIKNFIPNYEYQAKYYSLDIHQNITFLIYLFIYGYISVKYLKKETPGDYLFSLKRNSYEKNHSIYEETIKIYFLNMIRIFKDLFLINLVLYYYKKYKNNKISKKIENNSNNQTEKLNDIENSTSKRTYIKKKYLKNNKI